MGVYLIVAAGLVVLEAVAVLPALSCDWVEPHLVPILKRNCSFFQQLVLHALHISGAELLFAGMISQVNSFFLLFDWFGRGGLC